MATMRFETWWNTFKPIKNKFDDNASCDGHMFETYGEELEYVKHVAQVAPNTVWTIIEGDRSPLRICNGYHYVNRFGYLITEVECPEGVEHDIKYC